MQGYLAAACGLGLSRAAPWAHENGYRLESLDTLGATFLLTALRKGDEVCVAVGDGRG